MRKQVLLFPILAALCMGNSSSKKMPTAEGNSESWSAEVQERETVAVCTADAWEHVWTDPKAHKDFDKKHISYATVQSSGDVEVIIPGRGLSRAGGPSHYMQYLYLKDETGTIRSITKFEHSDEAFPWVTPAALVEGASTLIPYSVDNIHGVWMGSDINNSAGDAKSDL
jgi:desulfoferrodoxin (superoxide reductase-like protein)